MNKGTLIAIRLLETIGDYCGRLLRFVPRQVGNFIAASIVRMASTTPQAFYPVVYPLANECIRSLYFNRTIHNSILHQISPGIWMDLDLSQKGQRLMALGRPYEPALTKFMSRALTAGDTFVDVGAHQGYHTLLAASTVGEKGRVIAFEPVASNMARLQRNIELNGFQTIVSAEHAAAADRTGRSVIHINPLNEGGASLSPLTQYSDSGKLFSKREIDDQYPTLPKSEEVTLVRLDEKISEVSEHGKLFIKIDVEGNETAVLGGMEGLFARGVRPVILCEVGTFSEWLEDWISSHRYVLRNVSPSGTLIAVPAPWYGRHGNFVFIPEEQV